MQVQDKAQGYCGKTQHFESCKVATNVATEKYQKHINKFVCFSSGLTIVFLRVFRVQQWAISFGKEIAALSARYSGAKLLQKVRDHAWMQMTTH